jgi:L-histidine N-alpha-methyltransferase
MQSIFATDVDEGLSATPKWLSSQYFYDDNGSRIFQQIMAMPEYYLTDREFEILSTRSKDIYKDIGFSGHFNIIELGAGDGTKTKELLANFIESGADITYVPIDISEEAISLLVARMGEMLPDLKVNAQVGDYFEVMDEVEAEEECPNLVLLLGSNIGNYTDDNALDLLKHINSHMRAGDKLLVGFDLQKEPALIHDAYDDPHGITRDFNLNLLTRINRELGGEFQLDQFDFYFNYDPLTGEARSYLKSLHEQMVFIGALKKQIQFQRDELISTELSKKYTLSQIKQFARESGFEFASHYLDGNKHFSDTLYSKAKS